VLVGAGFQELRHPLNREEGDVEIFAANLHGGKRQDSVPSIGAHVIATRFRQATFTMSGVRTVSFQGVSGFVQNVASAAQGEGVDRLYIHDHGYRAQEYEFSEEAAAGLEFQGDLDRRSGWSYVEIQFGISGIHQGNFSQYESQFRELTDVLNPGAQVVFLNCSVGRDPGLLLAFARCWEVPCTGSTAPQGGVELVNIINPRDGVWITVSPEGQIRERSSHPVWGPTPFD
jgi:hypothetical protein